MNEDFPFMSLVRHEFYLGHYRLFVKLFGSLFKKSSKNTKALDTIKEAGLYAGLQAVYTRFMATMSLKTKFHIDPLIPNPVDPIDVELCKELVDNGLKKSEAKSFIKEMGLYCSKVAISCESLRQILVQNEIKDSVSLNRSGDNYTLIYKPDPHLVEKYVFGIKDLNKLPKTKMYVYTEDDIFHLKLNEEHFKKLVYLYKMNYKINSPSDDRLFIKRLYCMLARYYTYTSKVSGFQGSLPHYVFDFLEQICGINKECFASPLNCYFPEYYSAFPDTDMFFGSKGSFFNSFYPEFGCFEVNPPFILNVITAAVDHIHMLLGRENPLLFLIIVPIWKDAKFYSDLVESPYLKSNSELARKEHDYVDGAQHNVKRNYWSANVGSTWFILNNWGSEKYFDSFTNKINTAWNYNTSNDILPKGKRVFRISLS